MEDHAGIAQLVEMYASMIYRIAYTRMQNVADAEDITQEVLLKYLKAGKTFRDEEHRKMWLIRVTVNTIKSSLTSAWRRHTVALDDVTEPSYEAADLPVLKEKVEKLPERYRLPIRIRVSAIMVFRIRRLWQITVIFTQRHCIMCH